MLTKILSDLLSNSLSDSLSDSLSEKSNSKSLNRAFALLPRDGLGKKLVDVGTLTACLLMLSACGASGLAHTVPDDAMQRVTGEDRLKLQTEAQGVERAQEGLAAVEAQKGSADDAVSAAQGEVSDAENALDALEERRVQIQKDIEKARAKVEWRREERVLADLKFQAAQAVILAARAQYELAKFRIVGRVETGGEGKFQERLKDFEAQLKEKQDAVVSVQNEAAAKERDVASMGSRF